MAKKITAPKTYNPGKGRPKEHLAYLNEREMAYLRGINGNNMERGPRNLPSFPPADAIGSSSNSTGTKTGTSTTKDSSYNSGTKGSKGGGASTQAPGAGTSSGKAPSGPVGGAGGQRGAGSNYGTASGRPGTTSPSSKSPASPMGGQKASFSSPSKAASYNKDVAAQQRSAVSDARGVVQSNQALKGDLQVGGIKTLSVGPMGTNVNVSQPLKAAPPSNPNPAKTNISQSISAQFSSFKYDSPVGPKYGPDNIAELNRREAEARAEANRPLSSFGTPRRTGSPIEAGGISTISRELPEPTLPMPMREYRPYDIVGAEQPYGAERVMGVETVPNPNESVVGKSIKTRSIGLEGANPYEAQIRDQIEAMNQVAAKNAAKNYGGFSLDPEQDVQREAINRGVSESVINASLSNKTVSNDDAETVPEGPDGNTIGPETPNVDTVATTEAPPSYVDPITQQPAYPEKGLPMKIAEHLGFFGKGLKLANWADRKMFDRMTPEQQAAAMERWSKQRDAYGKSAGTDNDRGPYRRVEPVIVQESTVGTKKKGDGSRPQAYYNWDAGINIPSPGDSDYTLYQKYLQEKAAARAAVS